MLDAIVWRFYMLVTKETKPFDWFSFWVFVGLQIITILFVAVPLWLMHRRRRKIEKWVTAILGFVADGQRLLASPPAGSAEIDSWNNAVDELIQKTAAFLQQDSPKAFTRFADNLDWPAAINPAVWVTAHGHYSELILRIRNLRAIIDNSEVYF